MKKIIPFTKELTFKTRIEEITDIEVVHNLKVYDDNNIKGSFLIDGSYKITDESINEEEFSYELPFTVEVNDSYDLSDITIKINDFYFEIINEEILKVNIELELSNVKEREIIEQRCYDEEIEEKKYDSEILDEFTDIIEPLDIEPTNFNNSSNNKITDMFSNINSEDSYKSYYVYIIRENDTLDSILTKYKITKEELEMYNDIKELKVNMKLIIPSSNE